MISQSQKAAYCVRGNALKCAIDYSAAGGTSPDTFEIAATGSMLTITQTRIPVGCAILSQNTKKCEKQIGLHCSLPVTFGPGTDVFSPVGTHELRAA